MIINKELASAHPHLTSHYKKAIDHPEKSQDFTLNLKQITKNIDDATCDQNLETIRNLIKLLITQR